MMIYDTIKSPIGMIVLAGDGEALQLVGLPESRHPVPITSAWTRRPDLFVEARRQFDAYFAGELTDFDLPLAPHGSEFQQRVWQVLRTIPYAATISYGELARRVGNPRASRAVGLANGANPLSIIVPCHRVIGANGSLTGYGGGLAAKRHLLDLERHHAPREHFTLS
ncbi:MAG: methylated-DNA--[protein]-cysteine S-methyltransferase [Dokdonella sp.]|uniref:methylated-DNA--[protein]-cysteine S-methyltransferase n=1 Tax=Dokdonella sp. TaxID=2291710 RepID=UPI002BADFCC9|nr:methylated-DNA--[protein]-cysteine S-methyltransferase [Xanthomonadales bacterium]HQW75395.1 methylated-DNA--[protein]-cysteine S-methyltransferase [Dokdonella sp.]MBK7210725.1 methylated-DNA--[protein]-cysteine S-methyltransferase [Xanthomonadales bacterium]HQX64238.1 methylated-DNA--[protein]-cysteine S-methyltransferase [Dokdonella sp.]HQY54467.1 methylated-DNA--[protein]-cysteine S-methyltransferase [Dokdonella sp.]